MGGAAVTDLHMESGVRLFDQAGFSARVRDRIRACGLTYRSAGELVGVNYGVIFRVCRGHAPPVEAYLRLKGWLDEHDEWD